jgi:hypothetical protein
VVETTQGVLMTALLEAGFPVYPVNPKTLERRRAPAGAKTDALDALDAYLLAKKGRSDLADLRRLAPDSPLVQELKVLTQDHQDQDGLIQAQTRLVNQLAACPKAYDPAALTLLAKLQQPTALAFLRAYPTLDAARSASVEELTDFLQAQPHYPGPLKAAHRLREQLHAPQLHADPVTTRAKARLMLALVSQLVPLMEHLMEHLSAYDQEIQRLFLTPPDSQVFLSLPGTGKRLAPRLLAGGGDDRERFGSAASVQRVSRRWRGPPPFPMRAARLRGRASVAPVSSPGATPCTSLLGSPPPRRSGRWRPIAGNGARGKAIALRCAPSRTCGCVSSMPCGASACATIRLSSSLRDRRMLDLPPNCLDIEGLFSRVAAR